MFVKDGMSIIGDRWIGRWFAKSLSENGVLCVHVIVYKLGYKIIYRLEYGTNFGQDLDIQGMVQDLQSIIQALVQDFTSCTGGIYKLHQILDIWLEHQGNKQVCLMGWWVNG